MLVVNDVFAKNLKYYLSRSGLSQAALAKKIGVSAPAISEWCGGKKMPGNGNTFKKIADALGIELADLLEDETTRGRREQSRRVMLFANILAHDEVLQTAVDLLRRVPAEDLPRVIEMIRIFAKEGTDEKEK